MAENSVLKEKVNQVKYELQVSGLWKKNMPEWVTDFEKKEILSHQDFADWLQFVYLPNILELSQSPAVTIIKRYVALQARKFFEYDLQKGKLLQLLIELDSLL
jgi:uncharacterized protein YqcC (DUF446 family)